MPFARRALVMWILVCTNVLSGAAMAGEVLDRIAKSGKLVVATDEYYRPYSYRNTDGELDGFDVEVEMAEAVAAHR